MAMSVEYPEDEFLEKSSKVELYPKCAALSLGICQFLFGMLSIATGITAICSVATYFEIGYGIWCGFACTISGIFCIISARRKYYCLIMTAMFFSILAAMCGGVQFALGVYAAYKDQQRQVDRDYNIYYEKNLEYYYSYIDFCTGRVELDWLTTWAIVDILLLVAGFFEGVFAIASSAICCWAACNRYKDYQKRRF